MANLRPEFEEAYADYVHVAQDPDAGEETDGIRIYTAFQQLVRSSAVTTEQISRKVGVLMKLQDCLENQNDAEQVLLASIKRDLDNMR